MSPTDVSNYLQERRKVALNELAYRFKADPEAIEELVKEMIQSGQVSRTHLPGSCGKVRNGCSCGSTCGNDRIIFEWLG